MSKKSHTTAHDTSTQQEIVLSRHDEDTYLTEELDDPKRRERMVARVRLLFGQRSLLFRLTVWGFIASVVIAFLVPSRYTSEARLMPPDKQASGSGLAMAAAALTAGSGTSGGGGGLEGAAASLLGLSSTSDIFVGILSSRTAEDALIQKFDLKRVYSEKRMEDAREDLTNHTSISVDRKSQIITIAVTDKNPLRAAAMAQSYVDQLDYLVAALSTSSARRERIFLEGRLQGVNQDLEAAEKSFSQFASKNTAIDVPAQGKAMVDAAAVLQGQLIAAESELQGLKQIYTDNNVRVRSVTARVAELQNQLGKLVGNDGTAAIARNEAGDSPYPSIRTLPVLGVTYADLYRQTKVQEAVYATLTQEYELAKVEEAKEIPTVKVLDPANVPDKRSFPPRLLIIVLGTVLAFCIGVTWIFAHAGWEATDSSDSGKMLVLEVVDTFGARLPWVSRNGVGKIAENTKFSGQLGEGQDQSEEHK
jgi:capsule polysaccharide export protein KpsE/RkpR